MALAQERDYRCFGSIKRNSNRDKRRITNANKCPQHAEPACADESDAKLRPLQWLAGLEVSISSRQRLLKVPYLPRTCANQRA